MFAVLRESLRAKVITAVNISILAALFIATVSLLLYDINSYRNFLRANLTTQAESLAFVVAPTLQFDDPTSARMNLRLLENHDSFENAAIFTPDGAVFASYSRNEAARQLPPIGQTGMIEVRNGGLDLFYPIEQSGNRLGTLYLRADYGLVARLWTYVAILAVVAAAAFIIASAIAIALARNITNPVQAITEIARRVVEDRDFTHRAEKHSNDEVGLLVDAFNTMLGEVHERTTELESANAALKRETETRREAEARLRLADKRKDDFLATLAHELRNPLAPMMNSIGLLKMEPLDKAASEKARNIIERQLLQLVRLVDDLLDVSRITQGKLVIQKAPVALEEVVRSALDTVEPHLEKRTQRLSLEIADEDVKVDADASRLAQILGNLLNNASKFSPQGSEISLSVTADETMAYIGIRDHGAGIAADQFDAIFDMFSQGGPPADQAQSGLGIGLALTRQLVELHGGRIDVESAGPDQGATFTVVIPRAKHALSEAPAVKAETEAREGHPARILVVDDNVDFANSLASMLSSWGHEVTIAHDSHQAVEAAKSFQPQFGILDIGLPGFDGYELARRIRSSAAGSPPVLVAVSGWAEDKTRSRDAGFSLHLVKPVQQQSLRGALRKLWHEHAT